MGIEEIPIRSNGQRIEASWFNSIRTYGIGVSANFTAYAGGGQANATALNVDLCTVNVCASNGDSVKLPAGANNKKIYVFNTSSNICSVYPQSGEYIDSQLVNVAYSLGAGQSVWFINSESGKWKSFAATSSSTEKTTSDEITNLTLTASVGSNALTIAIKDKDGNNPSSASPVKIGFRNSSLTSGSYNQRSITAASSGVTDITVNSTATLGHGSALNHYIYVYLIDNSGTPELAVSTVQYEDHSIVSTTAMSTAADSNSVIYSTTARSNVPIRLIGRMLSNQTTAGTWAAVPTEIKLVPFNYVPISACYTSNAGNNITSGADNFLDYEDRVFDTHNIASGMGSGNVTTTNTGFKVTVPKTAKYDIHALWTLNNVSINATSVLTINIYVNGTYIVSFNYEIQATSTAYHAMPLSALLPLTAGDRVEITGFQNDGSSKAMLGNFYANRFSITEVV